MTNPTGEPAQVDIREARDQLSKLLQQVAAGEEIVITRDGVPVARLVPVEGRSRRVFGIDRGRFEVPEDFDSALPEEVLRDFSS